MDLFIVTKDRNGTVVLCKMSVSGKELEVIDLAGARVRDIGRQTDAEAAEQMRQKFVRLQALLVAERTERFKLDDGASPVVVAHNGPIRLMYVHFDEPIPDHPLPTPTSGDVE